MRVLVARQACCMADDMTMPLELAVELPDGATLEELAGRVVAADFLQFSSTHHTLTGFAEGGGGSGGGLGPALLTINAAWWGGKRVRYAAPPGQAVAACLPDRRLALLFRQENNG